MSLIAKDIYKTYKNGAKEIRAVNGMSLSIERGKSYAVIGPSGAGKSTLLHLMGGLDVPSSGEVSLDGAEIYKMSDRERARIRASRIGFVFQFYNLLPEFTALENVIIPMLIKRSAYSVQPACALRASSGRRTAFRRKAKGLLESVGLGDRMDHKPSELSGGESQRVAIVRAVINEPEFLLCDEPTGNLDSKNSEAIYKLLFEIKESLNTALVIVTHDEKISSLADEIIRIKDGQIA